MPSYSNSEDHYFSPFLLFSFSCLLCLVFGILALFGFLKIHKVGVLKLVSFFPLSFFRNHD